MKIKSNKQIFRLALLLACLPAFFAQADGLIWPKYEKAVAESQSNGENLDEDDSIAFSKKWISVFKEYVKTAQPNAADYGQVMNELLLHLRDTGQFSEALKYSKQMIDGHIPYWSESSGTALTYLQLTGLVAENSGEIKKEEVLQLVDGMLADCKIGKYKDDILGEFRILSMCARNAERFDADPDNARIISIYEYMADRAISTKPKEYAEIILADINAGMGKVVVDEYLLKLMPLYPSKNRAQAAYEKYSKNERIDKVVLAYASLLSQSPDYSGFSNLISSEQLRPYNIFYYIKIINYLLERNFDADMLIFSKRVKELYNDSETFFSKHPLKDFAAECISQLDNKEKKAIEQSHEN